MSQAPLDTGIDSILTSRTFWLNILGPLFTWAGAKWGLNLDADTQAAVVLLVMSVANIVMRRFTSRPVAFTAAVKALLPLMLVASLAACAGGSTLLSDPTAIKINNVAATTEATVCGAFGTYYKAKGTYQPTGTLLAIQEGLAVFCSGDPKVGSTPTATLINLSLDGAKLIASLVLKAS